MKTIIKPIPNFSGYFISNKGIIMSRKKSGMAQDMGEGYRILSPQLCFGYKTIRLFKEKKYHKRFLHRLVLETFIGKPKKGYQCRHLNGDRLNITLSNLKWGTRKENALDMVKHGKSQRGRNNFNNKLTISEIKAIRKMVNKNMAHKEIAKVFSIAPSTVSCIGTRRIWRWLK